MSGSLQLLTIGDSSIDQFMKVEEDSASELSGQICFIHGSKIPIESFDISVAGNALNVAAGTSLLGIRTALYTEIGGDSNADLIIEEMNKIEVNTNYCIKNVGTPTDVHPIVMHNGERTIFIYHEKRYYKIQNWEKPQWIYYSSIGKNFQNFQLDLINYVKNNQPIGFAFNPGTYHLKNGAREIEDVLKVTDILFVNKEEAQKITNNSISDPKELHKSLTALGPKLTVITDGPTGASAMSEYTLYRIDAYQDNSPIVDKTGAGDAFSSGFISAIIKGKKIENALRWGAINSRGTIRDAGAINGLRSEKEIEDILKANPLKVF